MLPTERAALVAWLLLDGARLSARDVAEMTGCTVQAAHVLLGKLARILPIYPGAGGKWGLVEGTACRNRGPAGAGRASIRGGSTKGESGR
jgi:hypothetical protein